MKQASRFDGLSFDPFSLFQDGVTPPEVDIGWGQVLQALVITMMVIVVDKGVDLLPEITGQVVGPIGRFVRRITLRGNFQRTLVPSCCF